MLESKRIGGLFAGTVSFLLAGSMIAQGIWFDRTASVTFDETFYANCAVRTVYHRRLDSRLVEYGVAPVPILLCCLPVAMESERESRAQPFSGGPSDLPLVSSARTINSALLAIGLLLTVQRWLSRRVGTLAALLGAMLVATSPTVLAGAATATPDGLFALTVAWALAALVWYRRRPGSPIRFAVLAAAVGLSISTKYSGVILYAVVGILAVADSCLKSREDGSRRLFVRMAKAAGLIALLVYVSFFFAWALHGFAMSRPLDNLVWPIEQSGIGWLRGMGAWSLPTPLAGILAQFLHNECGHPAFLCGDRSTGGWWAYYPTTLLLKSTPVELFIACGLLGIAAWTLFSRRHAGKPRIEFDAARQTWLCAAAVYLALLICSRINIGHRYTLPLYPLLVLGAIDVVWPLLKTRPTLRITTACLFALAQILSSSVTAPDQISYFTPFIGGPGQGYRYLVDSNVDWGQDLPKLKTELDRHGYRRVVLAYFGTAQPEDYGVRATRWGAHNDNDAWSPDALAVSVTTLQGAYDADRDTFAPFRELAPAARAGNSIMIYDLRDPRARAAYDEALGRSRFRALSRD